MNTEESRKAFEEAQRVLPGGVNSPVRAFRAVGGKPLFVKRGHGAWIEDLDGNRYVDHVCSWGPLILGHAHPEVIKALQGRIPLGTSFGIPTELETVLAEKVIRAVPSMEKVRFVNSGTEATMSAVRVARGHTGRSRVIKFEGCYHGHVDALLVKAGSGAATFGTPDSPGIPAAVTGDTLVLPFNDLEAVERAFQAHGSEVAAVLLEPVAGNMGLVPPKEGFLSGLREMTERSGSLLIFDEVITGFRLGLGGAQ
jgi:glutamate-1-semialdehyde 2,1-aminomutase